MTVGGVALAASWENTPTNGGPGLYHGTADFGTNTGVVVVSVGSLTVTGKAIAGSCLNGIINWNAWVGSAETNTANSVQPAVPQGCIAGTGTLKFQFHPLLLRFQENLGVALKNCATYFTLVNLTLSFFLQNYSLSNNMSLGTTSPGFKVLCEFTVSYLEGLRSRLGLCVPVPHPTITLIQ